VTAIAKGTVLADRYRLVERLGEGSMGSVWRAEHLTLGSEVAIKLLDASIARHSVALARFMREARSAASLKSVHVVQIHDFGVFGEIPYIAMELLRGETLGARVRRLGKLDPGETAQILTHVARAIGKAHEAGVVHRDLKPDNIFLVREDDEEFAKVLDFGVAKAGEGVFAATLTSAGKLLGTPAYMSAEQAAGTPVDRRTDLWAMAVIAFECLTGTLPFIGDDLPDLLHAIHDGPIPIPSRLGRVPVGFDAWFARGVARRLDDRFRSAREMAAELRRICADDTAGAPRRGAHGAAGLGPEDDAEENEPTGARIAGALGTPSSPEEEIPSSSAFDDIIRDRDILVGGRARPADDILTDADFDEETCAAAARVGEAPAAVAPVAPPLRSAKPPPKPRRPPVPPPLSLPEPAPEPAAAPAPGRAAAEPQAPLALTSVSPTSERAVNAATVVTVTPRRKDSNLLLIAGAIVVLGTVVAMIAFTFADAGGSAAATRAPGVPSAALPVTSAEPADPTASASALVDAGAPAPSMEPAIEFP